MTNVMRQFHLNSSSIFNNTPLDTEARRKIIISEIQLISKNKEITFASRHEHIPTNLTLHAANALRERVAGDRRTRDASDAAYTTSSPARATQQAPEMPEASPRQVPPTNADDANRVQQLPQRLMSAYNNNNNCNSNSGYNNNSSFNNNNSSNNNNNDNNNNNNKQQQTQQQQVSPPRKPQGTILALEEARTPIWLRSYTTVREISDTNILEIFHKAITPGQIGAKLKQFCSTDFSSVDGCNFLVRHVLDYLCAVGFTKEIALQPGFYLDIPTVRALLDTYGKATTAQFPDSEAAKLWFYFKTNCYNDEFMISTIRDVIRCFLAAAGILNATGHFTNQPFTSTNSLNVLTQQNKNIQSDVKSEGAVVATSQRSS